MLIGSGRNIGVSAVNDGILILDNQFAPLPQLCLKYKPVNLNISSMLIINDDHTGGNNLFEISGVILAHHNIISRLSGNTNYTPAGLPNITYHQNISIHFNGDNLQLLHMGPSHTNGDNIVL